MTRRSNRSEREILDEALNHLEIVQQHATGDLDLRVTVDAICMRLSAGIESLARLDPNTRDAYFSSTWTAMWGMRNRIAHGYMLVDPDIIRSTLERDVPGIIERIHHALDTLA